LDAIKEAVVHLSEEEREQMTFAFRVSVEFWEQYNARPESAPSQLA
jgi:hypothetical protein